MSKTSFILRQKEARQGIDPRRLVIVIALFTSFVAVLAGRALISSSTEPAATPEVVEVEVEAKTVDVVVTARNVPYNHRLQRSDLRVIKWPAESKPEQAFGSFEEIFSDDQDRHLLSKMAKNEVLLPSKLTQPGNIATLASLLGKNTRAMSVKVDAVTGVSSFVRPGDFVDVIMTYSAGRGDSSKKFSSVLLQHIHVLGVDKVSRAASDASEALVKRLPKTVTLEVDLLGAQKLALGQKVGRLSLALRRRHGSTIAAAERISVNDLSSPAVEASTGSLQLASSTPAPPKAIKKRTKMIGVTRATKRTEQEVVREDAVPKP